MLGWWLSAWMATAWAGPTWDAWLEAVLRASAQDAATASPERLEALLSQACDDGVAAACARPAWLAPFDRYGAAEAAESLCEAGDPVSCLVLGWHESQEPWATFAPDRVVDPEGARARFERACSLGLPRGCTEVAHTVLHGIGTYASRDKANEALKPLCDAGEPHACRSLAPSKGEERTALLTRAAELGDPLSSWLLAQQASGTTRQELTAEACEAGVGSACVARARAAAGEERLATLSTGCALSHDLSCTHLTVEQFRRERIDAATARRQLDTLCRTEPRACNERELVARDVVPETFYRGGVEARDRLERVMTAHGRRCYLDRLTRGEAQGPLLLDARLDAGGGLQALVGRASFSDEVFQDCLVEAARNDTEVLATDGTPARHTFEVVFGHAAEMRFDSPKSGVAGDITTFMKTLRQSERALDACALGQNVDVETALPLKVKRSGQVADVDTSALPSSARGCVGALLMRTKSAALDGTLKGTLHVKFFQPAEPVRTPQVVERVAWEGEPLTWRLLVLMVTHNDIGTDEARLTKKMQESILDTHAATERYIEEHTFGQVDMVVETLRVEGPLLSNLTAEEGQDRYRIEPEDIPFEWLAQIEPGRYHSVYLWAPVPAGYPLPKLGWAWGGTGLRGATFTSSVLPQGSPVWAGDTEPMQLILHELYHTLEYRARSHLLTSIPANHAIHRLDDGRYFNPRFSDGQGAAAFYDWAYDEKLFPAFWTDVLTYGAEANAPKRGNLAYDAVPIGSEGASALQNLNDAVRDYGRFRHAAWVAPEDPAPWWGLTFPEPVAIGRVVAPLTSAVSRTATRARKVAVEVRRGEDWDEVATADVTDTTVTLTFAPVKADAVRLRVVERDEGWVACRELEVYGE